MKISSRLTPVILLLSINTAFTQQEKLGPVNVIDTDNGVLLTCDAGKINLGLINSNILRVDVQPGNQTSPRTLMIDPALKMTALSGVTVSNSGEFTVIHSAQMTVSVSRALPLNISITDAAGKELLEQFDPLEQARWQRLFLAHTYGENLYGMSGLGRLDNAGGVLRNNGSEVQAGAQGEGGAPFFFTTRYGVLVDSDGGAFFTGDGVVDFRPISRDELEYFVIVGSPKEVISGVAALTGRPPMPPKWTLGFLNSQWGSDEAEIKQNAAMYRAKHIPIDAFILDYDWKAWGEDDYGEWRWNANKFPDGSSGEFAKELRDEGFKLGGILKPKIFLYQKGSTNQLDEAAAYATKHDLWYPDEPKLMDNPPVRDLDFAKAETRSWYWDHLIPAFNTGMVGWWNDEADHTTLANGQTFNFNNFQFFNMGRMLYEGQRGCSDLRVWSINRNFYLGAQRYGYAEWSGDIMTGFECMQDQRVRMLATLDLGEPHWSMDTGSFFGGQPSLGSKARAISYYGAYMPTSPENYARWMEFGAFTPIFRVHGSFDIKRQPWLYGPVAEVAAVRAIRLRYELLPYLYSYERVATETGVGIVRPLFWVFPDDPCVSNESSEWMFGDALLVSPVVAHDETEHPVYLPSGVWYDYFNGTRFEGGRTVQYNVDFKTWQDIPLFVHEGSIIATEPVQDYTDQRPVPEVTLDVFPGKNPAQFAYYDDDGETYAYEHGVYYRQPITVSNSVVSRSTCLKFDAPSGSYQPPLKFYLVKIHGIVAKTVLLDGNRLPQTTEASLVESGQVGWSGGKDRFGRLTIMRIPAARKLIVSVQ
jgi:alpha-glucosidase (family GH31 glycosyl hydrolase)